jgi:cytochrome c553
MSGGLYAWFAFSLFLACAHAVAADPPAESPEEIRARTGTGDPQAGKAKAESELCQGCHGEAGLSVALGAPHLAGQQAAYLVKQLRDFRFQERRHRTMTAMAEGLGDGDMADIAAYFASRPRMAGEPVPADQAAKDLFLYGDVNRNVDACVGCHELKGQGRLSGGVAYPRIAGQVRGYLLVQLLNWKIGARANSPGGVMNRVAGALSEAELAALAEYISGL